MKLRGRADTAQGTDAGSNDEPDRVVVDPAELAKLTAAGQDDSAQSDSTPNDAAPSELGQSESSQAASISFLDSPPTTPDVDMPQRSGFYILRKAVREFGEDGGPDLAAALTYWGVLAIFPAMLALASVLGLVGESERAVNFVLDVVRPILHSSTTEHLAGPLRALAHSKAAGATFAVGLVGALWAASGYVAAFGRAMNKIYEVEEGRPFWRLAPLNVFVTLVTVLLSAASVLIIGVSGPVARSLGDRMNIGHTAVETWDIAKWPVLALIVVVMIALLYYLTPNVKQGRMRLLSVGAVFAVFIWVVATIGLGIYVASFQYFDHVYGSLAGGVVFLLWLFITNAALVLGAELDSEIERARQLHRGIDAEEGLKVTPKSVRKSTKAAARREKDHAAGRDIREARLGAGDPEDRPF